MRMSHPSPLACLLLTGAALPLLASGAAAQTFRLDEIVVTAHRTPTEATRTGASVAVVERPALAARGGDSVGEVLARLPGIHFHQSGGTGQVSGFSLRGLPQAYVPVYVDGIEISEPSSPQPFASLSGLPARSFDRIEVLKGSQSALWGGRAVSGVISLETTPPERDGFSGEIRSEAGSYGTVGGSLSLGVAGEGGDFKFVLDTITTDGFSAADEDDGNSEDDGYWRRRLSFSGNLYPREALRLFASGFVNDEEGDYDAAFPFADSDDRFEVLSRGLRAGGEIGTGATTHTLSASWFDIERAYFGPNAFGSPLTGERLTFDYLGEAQLTPEISLVGGADHRRERAVNDGSANRSRLTGAFLQGSFSHDGTTLSAALRHDEHSEFGGHTTGRVTASHEFPTGTVLRASFGSGFRPPSLYELFSQYGDPDLESETSLSYDLGIEQVFADGRGRAGATLFRIEVDDLIVFDSDPGPDSACNSPFGCYAQATEGTSVSKGVELFADYSVRDGITVSASYTYTDAEEAADGGSIRRSRVPRHDFALGFDAAWNDRFGFGVEVRRVEDTVENGLPLDDYTLVGARAHYALNEMAEITLRAENLLDSDYQVARGYGTAGRSAYLGLVARF